MTNAPKCVIIVVGEVSLPQANPRQLQSPVAKETEPIWSARLCFFMPYYTDRKLTCQLWLRTMLNPHDIHTLPFGIEEQSRHSFPEDRFHVMLEKLENIHTVLQSINSKQNAPSESEIENDKFIQPLFKPNFGGNWIYNRRGRLYIYVAAPVPTALSVTSALGPVFVLTVPAITFPNYWNLLDIPEASSIMLDATATANQMNLHVLLTNRKL